MAPFGQTCAQTVQPTHWFGSMWAFLSRHGDGRAGYLQAALAADTFLLVHHALADVVLDALDEQARASRDDGSGDLGGKRVLHGLLHGLKILRIDDVNILVAVGGEDVLDLQGLGDVALQRCGRCRGSPDGRSCR